VSFLGVGCVCVGEMKTGSHAPFYISIIPLTSGALQFIAVSHSAQNGLREEV
jgi:hypothetical protein